MIDPVVAADGVTYERTAIEDWFGRSGDSPLMGASTAESAARAAVSSLRACLHRGQLLQKILGLPMGASSRLYI